MRSELVKTNQLDPRLRHWYLGHGAPDTRRVQGRKSEGEAVAHARFVSGWLAECIDQVVYVFKKKLC